MPKSCNGKILKVDLSNEKIEIENPSEVFYRRYMGGRNWAAYHLLKENKPNIDPFNPENRVIFATSIITGVPIPGACRFTGATKSPLTGGYGEAEAGGWWGPELKFAGYDAVVISGKADRPVYLWIQDGEVEIRPAEHLWGKTTGKVERLIRKELGDDRIRVLQIGPAGEKLVRFAGVVNELRHFNGRTGIGAVMGSKNLRAIAVRGNRKIKVNDPEKIRHLAKWFSQKMKQHPGMLWHRDLGTAKAVVPLSEMGMLPTRNFREGTIDAAEMISGERMKETIIVGEEGCYACPVKCKKKVKIEGKHQVDPIYGSPEYETIGAFGPLCGIVDIKAIAKANELCNKYGIDTISTGAIIAFAMECYENGIITNKDTDGIDLKFGSAKAMLKLVEMIANRKGIGDILAEGSLRAAKKFGKGAEKFAIQVKGQECPLHEPRGKWGVGLGYAVSPTGADHLVAAHDPCFETEGDFLDQVRPLGILEPVNSLDLGPQKIRLFSYLQCAWSLYNVLDICIFVGVPEQSMFSFRNLVEIIEAATGWRTSVFELMKLGERSVNLTRIFNIREGFTSKEDTLPERFFQPLQKGPLEGKYIPKNEFIKALDLYYKMRGWSSDGIPQLHKLQELDIEWASPSVGGV